MSTARSTGRATSSRPTWSAPSRCCRRRSATGARCRRAAQDAFRFHHISTDEVFGSLGDDGQFCETTAYDPRSPYSASKAVVRSSRARLAPHLRPAGGRHQLLEQLRPVSFPREADPADDHQRARGHEAAGLRQGRQCPRLALCRGSCARAAGGGDRRGGRARPIASAGATSGPISTWSRRSAR